MTNWKSQIGKGKYCLQFETDDYEKYKEVEKVAQKMVDKSSKEREQARNLTMWGVGYL